MDDPHDLETAFEVLDSGNELLRAHRTTCLRLEESYILAKSEAGKSRDPEPHFIEWMRYRFVYLAAKFETMWFDTEKAERAFRHYRPDWEYFTPMDFEALISCLL